MPLKSLLQYHALIVEDKWHENQQKMDIVAWQTRTLAQFIAGTVSTETGHSPLMEFADDVALTEYQREVREWHAMRDEIVSKEKADLFYKNVDPETGMLVSQPEIQYNNMAKLSKLFGGAV